MIREAFFRAGAKQDGVTSLEFLDAILEERPDLKGLPAYFPKQGYNGYTAFIGDEVFKGPRLESQSNDFEVEYQLLQYLNRSGVDSIPEVTCVGDKAFFYGMKRMEGVILPNDFTTLFSPGELQALAHDIIAFAVGMSEAFPKVDGKVMGHNDYNPGNILIDPDTHKLMGIIDFGYANYVATKDCHCFQGLFADAKEILAGFNKMLDAEYARRTEQKPASAPRAATAPAMSV